MSALTPYRVLDLTDEMGWLCGKLMADLGADVIKIEPPGGDRGRSTGPFWRGADGRARGLPWLFYNAGKRGVTADLDSVEGRACVERLVTTADFVIESFPPGYLDDRGLGFARLSALNPQVILTSITPFGQTGPYARYRAGDLVVWSMGGMVYPTGDADRPPVTVSQPQAFLHAAADAAIASMVAHFHRLKTGRGQHVDVSMQEAVVTCTIPGTPTFDIGGGVVRRTGWSWAVPRAVVPLVYPCKDGAVTLIVMGGGSPAYVTSSTRLVEWMGEAGMAPAWLRELDWVEAYDAARLTQSLVDRVTTAVTDFLLTLTKAEIYEQAMAHAILAAPVNTVADIAASPQLEARGYWVRVDHEGIGAITFPGPPIRASATPFRIARRAPEPGEHDEAVFGVETRPARLLARELDEGETGETGVVLPLHGIHVLELSSAAAGPMIGRYLANWGATVAKVESHRRPDIVRMGGVSRDGVPGIDKSSQFADLNSSKLSVALDVSHPEAGPVVDRLLLWSDVVIENMRPGAADRFGFGLDAARRQRPNVVYCSSSFQGATGPLREATGFGNQAGALAGLSEVTGWADRLPLQPFGAVTDFFSPRVAAFAVLAALDHRRRTGEGQHLDQSQIETSLLLLAGACLDYAVNGVVATRSGNRRPDAAPHGVFPCAGDDRWCAISVRSDAEWSALCEAAGRPQWASDPCFASLSDRMRNEDELEAEVGAWTETLEPEVVMSRLQAAGVEAGVVADGRDLIDRDPQLRHRGHFRYLDHPAIGVHAYNAPAFRLSAVPDGQTVGPCLGQHDELVYCGFLGMTNEELVDLRRRGVVTTAADLSELRQAY